MNNALSPSRGWREPEQLAVSAGGDLVSQLPMEVLAEISRHLPRMLIFRLVLCSKKLARVLANDQWWARLIMYHWSTDWARQFAGVADQPPDEPPERAAAAAAAAVAVDWMPWKLRFRYFAQHLRWLRPYRRCLQMDPRVKRVYILADYETIRPDALAFALTQNTALTDLGLGRVNLRDEGMACLAAALPDNRALVRLSLEGNKACGAPGVTALCQGLDAHRTLRHLDLMDVPFGAEGARALGDLLGRNHCPLRSLVVGGAEIEGGGARALAAGLHLNESLRWLYLSRNTHIGNEGAADLAEALLFNSSLQTLHLANVGAGPAAVAAFADCLCQNRTLRHLDLSDNEDLGNAVGRHLLRAFGGQQRTRLAKFWMTGNKFSAQLKRQLRQEVATRQSTSFEFYI